MDDKTFERERIKRIENMTYEQMARLWRFASPGHIYFDKTKPFWVIFEKRFKLLGGFTPAISKEIGW